jgi:hypothetical protein
MSQPYYGYVNVRIASILFVVNGLRKPIASVQTVRTAAIEARRLDFVVNSVAARLMGATASTAAAVSQQVLAHLVEQFDAGAAVLRHHDHNIRASKLITEWPPRPGHPDPDPLEVVHFASADPVVAYCGMARNRS